MESKQNKTNLPSISELYGDQNLEIVRKKNDLNVLLNQKPKKEWLMKHPFATKDGFDEKGKKVKVPIDYLSIQRVEWLLTTVFMNWSVEVKKVQLIANSIAVTIRLHYQDPITKDWHGQDGVGAAPLQTDKDAGAADWNAIKSNAVMIGLPAAKTFAVKDAAEQIGKLFGKDMNRFDDIAYSNLVEQFGSKEQDEILAKIKTFESLDKLRSWFMELPVEVQKNKLINVALNEQQTKIEQDTSEA
jgi:hypothetical protein